MEEGVALIAQVALCFMVECEKEFEDSLKVSLFLVNLNSVQIQNRKAKNILIEDCAA